jgi:poly(3-hydroxybutyrate) depolymerase
MTAVMLVTYPELFAGGAIVAGLPYGIAHSVPEAIQAMHRPTARSVADLATLVAAASPPGSVFPPLSIWHGDADWTVNVSNAEALALQRAARLGLSGQPSQATDFPKYRRSVWRPPGSEASAIEFNVVFGMGHGAPVATTASDRVGTVAPFVLEAGVSSTLEIARFWGLAPGKANDARDDSSEMADQTPAPAAFQPDGGRIGERVMAAVRPHVSPGVSEVITKALRSAGLL